MIGWRTAALAFAAVAMSFGINSRAWADDLCRTGDFTRQQSTFALGWVTGAGRVHFRSDSEGCPSDAEHCLEQEYVGPGDRLVLGRTHGKFVCAYHPHDADGSAGWIPSDQVRTEATGKRLPPQAWAGRWKNGDDWIQLAVSGNRLRARGRAYWPALHVPPDHLGRFSGTALFRDGPMTISDRSSPDACKVTMQRVGPWLLVSDNRACGGLNVTFTGVYRRDQVGPKSAAPRTP